jgi:hypothetical protein
MKDLSESRLKDVICHVRLDCAYVIHLQGFRECRIKVPQWILACIAVLRLMSKRVVMLGSFVAGLEEACTFIRQYPLIKYSLIVIFYLYKSHKIYL